MHQPPQGESIWGTINTCTEIALNIYMIIAKDANGTEHTGVMAKKPANKSQVLFSRFLKLFVNLFLCTIRRPALYPAYTKS